MRRNPFVIGLVAIGLAAGCTTAQQPVFPTIAAPEPTWGIFDSPKVFQATVTHPHIDQWEVLAAFVDIQSGSSTGLRTASANGPQLSFTLPSEVESALSMAMELDVQWVAKVRLRGGSDQIEIRSDVVRHVVPCLFDSQAQKARLIPMENVSNLSATSPRLTVISPCASFDGTVALVYRENDGDTHINLIPDAGFEAMLRPGNDTSQAGQMVAEIVPADKPGCTPGSPPPMPAYTTNPLAVFGTCTGAAIADPAASTPLSRVHLRVIGPHVVDTLHGPPWAEIHPIWRIVTLP